MNKDIENLKNILIDLEDAENGAIINLSQDEIDSLKSILKSLNSSISKDKIREKIKKYQEIAEDVKQKYKGVYAYRDDYLEALAKIEGYEELLEEQLNDRKRT